MKTRMKVCRDWSQTEDPILHREIGWCLMDLLVGGPGLVLRSVPGSQPTHDGFELELLL
jgi:hypothetical protein